MSGQGRFPRVDEGADGSRWNCATISLVLVKKCVWVGNEK